MCVCMFVSLSVYTHVCVHMEARKEPHFSELELLLCVGCLVYVGAGI